VDVRVEVRCERHHAARAAETARQAPHAGVEGVLEALHGVRHGPPEGVDGLRRIAHRAQDGARRHAAAHEEQVGAVEVLRLVDEHGVVRRRREAVVEGVVHRVLLVEDVAVPQHGLQHGQRQGERTQGVEVREPRAVAGVVDEPLHAEPLRQGARAALCDARRAQPRPRVVRLAGLHGAPLPPAAAAADEAQGERVDGVHVGDAGSQAAPHARARVLIELEQQDAGRRADRAQAVHQRHEGAALAAAGDRLEHDVLRGRYGGGGGRLHAADHGVDDAALLVGENDVVHFFFFYGPCAAPLRDRGGAPYKERPDRTGPMSYHFTFDDREDPLLAAFGSRTAGLPDVVVERKRLDMGDVLIQRRDADGRCDGPLIVVERKQVNDLMSSRPAVPFRPGRRPKTGPLRALRRSTGGAVQPHAAVADAARGRVRVDGGGHRGRGQPLHVQVLRGPRAQVQALREAGGRGCTLVCARRSRGPRRDVPAAGTGHCARGAAARDAHLQR
jgi:hypothetical protein